MRPLARADLPALIRLRADEELSRYLGGPAWSTPEAVARRLRFYLDCHARYGYGQSAISLKAAATGEMIGWSGIQPLEDSGETEVGYAFARQHWGRGYATEAAAAWLSYGFERVGLARIVAVANPANTASRHVMEKLGMRFERLAQHYGNECVLYAITRAEFVPRAGLYEVRDESKGGDV
jgi:RimJ/RimL family protein N-acetyltransferase